MLNLLQDQRVSVHVTGDMLEWELVIDDVTEEDAGQYECQVNTNPLSQLKAVLRVTSMFNDSKCLLYTLLQNLLHTFKEIKSCLWPRKVF